MSLIICDSNCIYQNDGYCTLDTPALVTENNDLETCIHFIKKETNTFKKSSYSIEGFSNCSNSN